MCDSIVGPMHAVPGVKMAYLPESGASLWSVIQQNRSYQVILFIVLPVLVLLQTYLNLTGTSTLAIYQLESTQIWKNAALERLRSGESLAVNNRPVEKPIESAAPLNKPYRLTVCAMVHNEVPYMVEWIEFHRLQGADHFVLYNYFGIDLVEYLPLLYLPYRTSVTVRVFPARFFGNDRHNSEFDETGALAMVDCYVQYRRQSQWILMTTGGHFTFSPKHYSIWEFLQNGNITNTAVRIPSTKFGTAGWQSKFRTWLSGNSFSGSVDLMYESMSNTTDVYPLVLMTNTMRAPHRGLDEGFADLDDCKADDRKRTVACSESAHITLINGNRYCIKSNMSECLSPETDTFLPEIDVLRSDNHEWRSAVHVETLIKLGTLSAGKVQLLDTAWYSKIPDTLKNDKYAAELEKRIRAVKPQRFEEVERECDGAMLSRGQQMKCPSSHPYPYGNFGVKFLRLCCKTDRDAGNFSMTLPTNSCWKDEQVECEEPVGTQKWLHRTCCVNNNETTGPDVIVAG